MTKLFVRMKPRIKKTKCKRGHLYTPQTEKWNPDTNFRQCRICTNYRDKILRINKRILVLQGQVIRLKKEWEQNASTGAEG